MIDAPGRRRARFPQCKAIAVRRVIAETLSAWRAGGDDLAICGGACGADILFAEACLELGARVLLLIALPEEDFVQVSVAFADADWETRYRALRRTCESRFQHEVLGPPGPNENVFARNNRWQLDTAYALVQPQYVHAVVVWDGRPEGDGAGGTADFAERVRGRGGHLAVIDLARLH